MTATAETGGLHRSIDWKGAFWIASGVPPLVLLSIGLVGGAAGNMAVAVWIASIAMGFVQSFTYAEISGLFPNRSGGVAVYGAVAWLKYGKLIAPLSVWCHWIARVPLLSLGCAIAAGYILNGVAPVPAAESPEVAAWLAAPGNAAAVAGLNAKDAAEAAVQALTPLIRSWTLLSFEVPGFIVLSIGAPFITGAILLLIVFGVQHRGILFTARAQMLIGLVVIAAMIIVCAVPLIRGKIPSADLVPFMPAAARWDLAGWMPVLGGLFIAAWSTYAFETCTCYTREFRNPASDTPRAIFYAGLLGIVVFTLVPLAFQGSLGVAGMTAPDIVDGTGVAAAMAQMAGGGATLERILAIFMILALFLALMTTLSGTSRTLYQGSVDGWLPRYLSRVTRRGAPARAMWTGLGFNLILLTFAASDTGSYRVILAVSACGYIISNFLSLHAGWIYRLDFGHIRRPYRASTLLLALGGILAFVNAMLMGAGAAIWHPNALYAGIVAAALIVPVFWFRHYVQDGGRFPPRMMEDLGLREGEGLGERKAGMLPYLTLLGGIAVVILSAWFFHR